MDMQRGIICSLTDEPAQFEDTCPDFIKDEKVSDVPVSHDPEQPLAQEQVPDEVLDKLRSEQNLSMGIIVGSVVGILSAILWGVITVATNYQIGFMAVAVGLAVGYSIRLTGKGIDPTFGFAGAIIALLAVALGNFFSLIGFAADELQTTLFGVFDYFSVIQLCSLMFDNFEFMDVVFYGIAIYEGYKFSFRPITHEDLNN
jgi:hypothetical protein